MESFDSASTTQALGETKVVDIAGRLEKLRDERSLTLEAVSDATGLGKSTLSDFENGKREPRLAQLKTLADFYHRPISYFLDDVVAPAEQVLWRERPASPVAEKLQARLIELADRYHTLEVLCGRRSRVDLPEVTGSTNQFEYAHAGALARQVRNQLGLGERPGQTLLRVLEELCGVKIFHIAFEPSGSAACTLSEHYGAAILLNSRNVRWRRNFDLAHELFHLLTWKAFRHDTDKGWAEADQREEKLATCFARNLLMPVEVFREAVDNRRRGSEMLEVDGLLEVAREFDVSVEAVLRQIQFVYDLAPDKITDYLSRIKDRIRRRDTRVTESPPQIPVRFEDLAHLALRKGLISVGRAGEYLGISRRDAMRLVEEDAEDDARIEVAHSGCD